MSSSKKLTCKGTLLSVFISLRPRTTTPPLTHLKGDFMYNIQHCFICRPSDSTVLEEAGIEPRTVATIRHWLSGALSTQLDILTHCIRVYSILITQGRGWGRESWTWEKVRGARVHKAGWNIPTWLTASPVYKLWTSAAKSLYRSIFRWWHFALMSI